MILITGAAGKTGRAIIRSLSKNRAKIRALVHRADQIQPIKKLGALDVLVGDLRSASTLETAVQGATAIYHICPNVSPDEISIGETLISAAQAAGAAHFVYHSVLHPQAEAMPHHWKKLRVEETLFESGLPFTVFQPTAYMQNILAQWTQIVESGVYPVPYPPETRLSLVDLEDVAQAATIVLSEPGHQGAIYELVGTEPLSQTELAAILGRQLNTELNVEEIPLDKWERGARTSGLGEYMITTLTKMFLYYAQFGMGGNPNVLGWILNRDPTSFEAFVERTLKDRLDGEGAAEFKSSPNKDFLE